MAPPYFLPAFGFLSRVLLRKPLIQKGTHLRTPPPLLGRHPPSPWRTGLAGTLDLRAALAIQGTVTPASQLILGDVLLQRVGKAGAASFGPGRGCPVLSPTSDFGQELRSPTLMETAVPWQGGPALQATSVHWAQGCPSPALWAPSQTGECHFPQAQEVRPSCVAPGPAVHTDRFTSSLCHGGT